MKLSSTETEKALECCSNKDATCNECVFYGNEWCRVTLAKESLRIINRLKAENKNGGKTILNQREQLKACNEKIKEQQAEIERLTPENERLYGKVEELSLVLSDTVKIRYKEAKSEARKEFTDRLIDNLIYDTYSRDFLIVFIRHLSEGMG